MTRAERVERAFAAPMIVVALLVIPLLILEGSDLGGSWPSILAVADWLIWSAFMVEAAVLLSLVDDRREWLRRHPVEVVVIVFSFPLFANAFAGIRMLRLLRLVRLLRVARLARAAFSVTGVSYVALLALLTVLGGGQAFADIEGVSLIDGLYWAATTVTTVGYGDISPHTDAGKALAVGVMLVGIGFVATLTGAVAERFVAHEVEEAVEEVEEAVEEVEETEADLRTELAAISERIARLQERL